MLKTITWAACAAALALPGASLAETPEERVTRVLSQRLPGTPLDSIAPSQVPGVMEVTMAGRVLYVTEDGRYVFSGKLIDLEQQRDLTEPVLQRARLSILATMPESRMLVYEPDGEVKHTITTFTDIDCPYCRRMHEEMPLLNDMGIRVRYMLFPRAGVNSDSYRKAVSVWCAEDRNRAMDLAKGGQDPEPRKCDNPVDAHMALARRLGLSGTPMTITDTGEKIAGYRPAAQLVVQLQKATAARP